jgi:hypothetical protein
MLCLTPDYQPLCAKERQQQRQHLAYTRRCCAPRSGSKSGSKNT